VKAILVSVFAGLLACSAASARGGWQICVWSPYDWTTPIHFSYKNCWITDIKTECSKEWASSSVESDSREGSTVYSGQNKIRRSWSDADVEKYDIRSQSGYFLVRFDESFSEGFQERIMQTRTIPFREFYSAQFDGGKCDENDQFRDDEMYHFSKEGSYLKLYNGITPE